MEEGKTYFIFFITIFRSLSWKSHKNLKLTPSWARVLLNNQDLAGKVCKRSSKNLYYRCITNVISKLGVIMYRTITSKEIDESLIGKQVQVAGWVSAIRDHGGIVFIELRDMYGLVQLTTHDDSLLTSLSRESVISVIGEVVFRGNENINPKIKSGKIEIAIDKLEVLSRAKHILPFEIDESKKTSEETRLKFRYLDLRNPEMQAKLKLRSDVLFEMRCIMREFGFEEIQTPILTVSSPEGARDYLVPSRVYKGKFYALPQAPQQFKQLLMCSGVDKYFQIAPCFRDEDARADRSPGEFYQLDMEMAFATQEDVFAVCEDLLYRIFKKFGKYEMPDRHFVKIPYKEALIKYGTDKPDLRNKIEMVDLSDVFKSTEFEAFRGKTIEGFAVCAESQPRSFFDKLSDEIISAGGKGLAWVRVLEDGSLKGPIVKFISDEECEALKQKTGARVGDDIFVVADESSKLCYKLASILRAEVGEALGLIEKDQYKFCWIVDFPMYEINEETGKIDFCHNPFSLPQGGLKALQEKDPLDILAYQYDIVLNGVELSSGAVRNAEVETMIKAFEIAGYSEEDVEKKFGALYTAFQYGAPPHAGVAPGIDRILMLLLDESNIREVIAFPMNSKAQDLMMGAPGDVTEEQLREVHIKLR